MVVFAMKLITLLVLAKVSLAAKSELQASSSFATTDEVSREIPLSFEEQRVEASIFAGSDSCYTSYKDCHSCNKASGCHWCAHDQRCHVFGSVYGCATGSSCDERDSCQQYPTCVECDATHTCHWCAKDESCHTMGSIYGCVRGVTCFDEDRCRRKKAEALPLSRQTFTNLGLLPLILVGVITSLAICCVSMCLCLVVRKKPVEGDTTIDEEYRTEEEGGAEQPTTVDEAPAQDAAAPSTTTTVNEESVDAENNASELSNNLHQETTSQPNESTEDSSPDVQVEDQQQQQQEERTPLLQREPGSDEGQEINEVQQSAKTPLLHRVCTCLYFLVLFTIAIMTFGFIRFFPMIPDYSVCNDGVQWGKLFENLATLHGEVDFEILMSIENANHLGVVVERGNGTFRHGDKIVGNYTIPWVEAPAMAISDALIMANLTPGTKEVWSLLEEYLENSLVLYIDADIQVRLPFLFNYSTNVSISDQAIAISREEDRHLCACKKWINNDTAATHHRRMNYLQSLVD